MKEQIFCIFSYLQERAKAEHRDKLGERDDTIPPEYRHLLDNDEEVNEGRHRGWIYSTKLHTFTSPLQGIGGALSQKHENVT